MSLKAPLKNADAPGFNSRAAVDLNRAETSSCTFGDREDAQASPCGGEVNSLQAGPNSLQQQ